MLNIKLICGVFAAFIWFFCAFSCNDKQSLKEILSGTAWTTVQATVNNDKTKIYDKVTFFKNDTFKVQMFYNERPYSSYSGKYVVVEAEKKLLTYIDTLKYEFIIVDITNEHFSLQDANNNKLTRYKKFEQ